MIVAALIYYLAHIGAISAAPATINVVAGVAVFEAVEPKLKHIEIIHE
jgi:hypothetical protein